MKTTYEFDNGRIEVVAKDGRTREMLKKALAADLKLEVLEAGSFDVAEFAEELEVSIVDLLEVVSELEMAGKVKIRQKVIPC